MIKDLEKKLRELQKQKQSIARQIYFYNNQLTDIRMNRKAIYWTVDTDYGLFQSRGVKTLIQDIIDWTIENLDESKLLIKSIYITNGEEFNRCKTDGFIFTIFLRKYLEGLIQKRSDIKDDEREVHSLRSDYYSERL